MTYDKTIADIFLPYGEIIQKDKPANKDFKAITLQKSKGAIMIMSRCKTASFREDYILPSHGAGGSTVPVQTVSA